MEQFIYYLRNKFGDKRVISIFVDSKTCELVAPPDDILYLALRDPEIDDYLN